MKSWKAYIVGNAIIDATSQIRAPKGTVVPIVDVVKKDDAMKIIDELFLALNFYSDQVLIYPPPRRVMDGFIKVPETQNCYVKDNLRAVGALRRAREFLDEYD